MEAARQWLGHTDLQTTLKYIYTTETIDSLRQYSQENSALAQLDLQNNSTTGTTISSTIRSVV